MGNKNEKIQNSEFEEKLRQSSLAKEEQARTNQYADTTDHSSRPRDVRDEDAYRAPEQTDSVPIIEERIRVDKKIVETGKVRIGKQVQEEEITLDIPTIHEEVDIERVAINEYVDDTPPAVRHEGNKMIIPVLKEVSVVVKKLMLVEELHITKRKIETHEEQKVTLRRESLDVKRVPNDDVRISSDDRRQDDRRTDSDFNTK